MRVIRLHGSGNCWGVVHSRSAIGRSSRVSSGAWDQRAQRHHTPSYGSAATTAWGGDHSREGAACTGRGREVRFNGNVRAAFDHSASRFRSATERGGATTPLRHRISILVCWVCTDPLCPSYQCTGCSFPCSTSYRASCCLAKFDDAAERTCHPSLHSRARVCQQAPS